MELDLVLRAVIAPALIAGGMVLLATLVATVLRRTSTPFGLPTLGLTGHGDARESPSRVSILLVPIVAAASAATLEGRPLRPFAVPAGTAFEWLPWSILAASLVAAAIGSGAGRMGAIAASFAAPAVGAALLVPPGMRDGTSQLMAAAIGALACLGSMGRDHGRGTASLASWWLSFSLASGMVLLSGFSKLAFVAASLAALAATLGVLAVFLRAARPSHALDVAFSCAFVSIAFIGAGYDEAGLPRIAWILLALSPACASIAELPWIRSRPRLRAASIVAAPALAIAAAMAMGFAATRSSATSSPDADLYGLASAP